MNKILLELNHPFVFKIFHFLLQFNYPHVLDLGDQYVEEKNDLQLSLMITKAPINNSNLNRKIFFTFCGHNDRYIFLVCFLLKSINRL